MSPARPNLARRLARAYAERERAERAVLRDVRRADFPAAETRQRLFDADRALRLAQAAVRRGLRAY